MIVVWRFFKKKNLKVDILYDIGYFIFVYVFKRNEIIILDICIFMVIEVL